MSAVTVQLAVITGGYNIARAVQAHMLTNVWVEVNSAKGVCTIQVMHKKSH